MAARRVQLTNRKDESESTPRWSPDGRYLAFISSRDDKKERDQLWLLDRTGGEARQLTDVDGSVVDYAWSPDGKSIALILLDRDPNDPPGDEKKDDDTPPKPIVIDRSSSSRTSTAISACGASGSCCSMSLPARPRRLTTGDFNEYFPSWSPDGTRIAFISNRDPDPDRSYNTDLWVVSSRASRPRRSALTTYPGGDNDPDYESYPAWSPDGSRSPMSQGGRSSFSTMARGTSPWSMPRGRSAATSHRGASTAMSAAGLVEGRQVAPVPGRGRSHPVARHASPRRAARSAGWPAAAA